MSKKSRTKIKKTHQGKSNGIQNNSVYQILFLVILVLVLYGNTLFNSYSFDDEYVILNNKKVEQGLKGIPEIFATRFTVSDQGITYGYRPVAPATFAIEHQFFGYAPGFSHFINIVLYALGAVLLFLILRRIFKNFHYLFPILITAIFIAHPVHTEVVASLKNRDELLVLLFAMLSLYSIIKYGELGKLRFLIIGIFSFLVGYLSKPTILPYVVIIPLTLYFFSKADYKKILIVSVSLVITFLLVRYLPKLYLPKGFRPQVFYENNIRYEDLFTRITTGFYILLFYLKKLVIPFPLLYYYGFNMIPVAGIGNPWVIVSILFHFGIFGYALYTIKQKNVFSFIILFYLISLVLFTNVARPVMGIVGERFLLTPSIAFSLILGIIIFIIFKTKPSEPGSVKPAIPKIILVGFIILIPYSAITINRNNSWKDHFTLFESDMKYLDKSVKANELYATQLRLKLNRGEFKQHEQQKISENIIKHYKQVLELYPEHHEIWNSLATIYSETNNPKQALSSFAKAIQLEPNEPYYYLNLGVTYGKIKKYKEAIRSWEKSIEIDSSYNDARLMLSKGYMQTNKPDLAIKVNNEIIKLDTLTDKPHENLGFIYLLEGDTVKAIRNWEIAVFKNPNNENICEKLYGYFKETGNMEKAKYYRNIGTRTNK